jgi:hypothetical protein
MEIVSLREQGFGAEVIASRVGCSVGDAREIIRMVDEIRTEKEAS